MTGLLDLLGAVAGDVGTSVAHNWPYLMLAVVVASLVQVYVGADHLARWLRRRTVVAVLAAVVVASLTPFCSCGTTAVVLGALASAVPWAPVVAFMVSSPLTSPEEYVLSTGLFGSGFATTFFVAAIVIGLAAGAVTHVLERRGWLVGQARMATPPDAAADAAADADADAPRLAAAVGGCACDAQPLAVGDNPAMDGGGRQGLDLVGPGTGAADDTRVGVGGAALSSGGVAVAAPPATDAVRRARDLRLPALRAALLDNARRLAVYFLAFAALGYLLIEMIPTHVLTTYLGGGSLWSVPLAATLGIPVYISSDASLPMVASLMHGGMGAGPALAFLITGAGTSVGAFSGMLVIARWRVIALVVGSLWVGAVLVGWLAPLWL